MSRLLALIVLCGMCISVSSGDDFHDCVFNFKSFDPEEDSDDIIIDFSELDTSRLREGGKNYYYIAGDLKTKAKVDSSIQVHYTIIKNNKDTVAEGSSDACEFSNIYLQYLKPIFADRGNLPRDTTICDWDPSDYHISKAKSTDDLVAKSKLDEGNYLYEITYMKDDTVVGGMSGEFDLIRYS